jgi:hypothetical protein
MAHLLASIAARARHCLRRAPRGFAGALAAALLLAAPRLAGAEFNCERSVAYNAERCEATVVFSIGFTRAKAICADFSRRLGRECRGDWDRFASCTEFSTRFEALLVKACAAHGMASDACTSWGQAFAVTPYNRCTQGRFSY